MAHVHTPSTMSRRAIACYHCREKKVKCDGSHPCGYCAARSISCNFPSKTARRKYRRRLQSAASNPGQDFNRLSGENTYDPEGLHEEPRGRGIGPVSAEELVVAASEGHRRHSIPLTDQTIHCSPPTDRRPTATPLGDVVGRQHASPVGMPNVMSPPDTTTGTVAYADLAAFWDLNDGTARSSPRSATPPAGDMLLDGNESTIEPNTGSEYHGATSILAICSAAAIDWITKQTKNEDYPRLSTVMAATITEELKLQKRVATERVPEPDFQTAWRYYEAYFQQPEASFLVIHRPSFESRLRQLFGSAAPSDDPAWYALRNTVYAAGKRHLLINNSERSSFTNIQDECWPYFENAMSVHTELLFSQVSIMGVQALIAMAMFVEGLGSPCLEYMLCTSASRLAQSQGLHRQPPQDCKMTEAQLTQRNLIFWSIYCYDKHISLRAGRPSAIDDRDITCLGPSGLHRGLEAVWVSKVIEHARLTSKMTAWMSVFRSRTLLLDESIRQLRKLDQSLTQWAESSPVPLRPGSDLRRFTAAKADIHPSHIIYIHYAYHGTTIALNSYFAWPWLSSTMAAGNESLYEEQARKSVPLVVEAARSIINLTHYIEIDCSTPVWMAFYYPFVAFVNLFVHILRNPTHSAIQMDLSLLDVIVGFFGRMDLATAARKSFPFVRDLVKCAHAAVAAAKIQTPLVNPVSEMAYETENFFSLPSPGSGDAHGDSDLSMDVAAIQDALGQAGSHLDSLGFDHQVDLFGLMETDLSWGMMSTIPRG